MLALRPTRVPVRQKSLKCRTQRIRRHYTTELKLPMNLQEEFGDSLIHLKRDDRDFLILGLNPEMNLFSENRIEKVCGYVTTCRQLTLACLHHRS